MIGNNLIKKQPQVIVSKYFTYAQLFTLNPKMISHLKHKETEIQKSN